jgi:hypothetical protein
MNYPDGMTKSDWAHVDGEGMRVPLETRVLRAVVYLTYVPGPEEYRDEDDEGIEAKQSPQDAQTNIERVLAGASSSRGLTYRTSSIEVVDAEYMSVEESEA